MSRTNKDKPWKYRTKEEKFPGVQFWRLGGSKRAKKVNLVKGYEDGPGGKDCSCCGVQHDYKGMMRRDAKLAIALALEEMKTSLGDDVCECDVCLTL